MKKSKKKKKRRRRRRMMMKKSKKKRRRRRRIRNRRNRKRSSSSSIKRSDCSTVPQYCRVLVFLTDAAISDHNIQRQKPSRFHENAGRHATTHPVDPTPRYIIIY